MHSVFPPTAFAAQVDHLRARSARDRIRGTIPPDWERINEHAASQMVEQRHPADGHDSQVMQPLQRYIESLQNRLTAHRHDWRKADVTFQGWAVNATPR